MLFFGLCLGDAGYGLLILLACTFIKPKVSADMKPVLSLAQWLGGTTFLVGALLSGSFFGVELGKVEALGSVKEIFLSQERMMQLSLGLGLFHIVFGKAVAAYKTKKQRGLKYSIAPWAWVFLLTPMLILFGPVILAMFGSPLDIPVFPQFLNYTLYGIAAASALVVLLYNSPGKNVGINIGSAIWTLYNVLSGMLGDTLSYVRLFAIGLTGGILGSVFNILAIQPTEGMPIFARIPIMLIVLVLGHGINIILSLIASLVHPLRLVFVEYFKNSQYEGGGIAYVPFKRV
jgi:V/A-type H+-transporting ATPase subunit I